MSQIFEHDSDSNETFKTNNEYARNYDIWRKKEELNKLKTKYGKDIEYDNESSSSSSDDEDGIELTEKVEKDFYKTLACLKKKDPRIYDKNVTFFEDLENRSLKKVKKQKDQPMYLKDYERNLILEKGGILSDEEIDEERPRSPTYVEEQKRIKESFKKVLDSVGEEDNEDWGGVFKERKKTNEQKEQEEADYKQWLGGQQKKLEDTTVEIELKPLKEYWNKPDLDEGEKFLRDYVLHKKFLDKDGEDYIPTYEEVIHDSDQDLSNDEETIRKQEEFEQKFNFRFEEPDQEFIKRYPRTVENSLRRKDDKRKVKRQELKERKKKEKDEKMQDMKKLQELKRQEIEEKLEKLKEITGNTNFGFADQDVDGDFDPDDHDRRMQALFNEDFYQGPEGEQKPEFPELDEELEIENWERYNSEDFVGNEDQAPHCEDEGFNMDCEYDSQANTQNELIERSKGKKKRKRKSKFAEAISQPKPKFDPNNKKYEEYFDEYYKLDCEDIIGDIPCRFKYRKVVPNDFGLTVEEILLAKERELNKWCSLKKAVQIRPDHVEKYEQIAYKKKGQDINLKKRILPSLFSPDPEDENSQKELKAITENKEKTEVTANEEKIEINNAKGNEDNVSEAPPAKRKKKNISVPSKEEIDKNLKNKDNVNRTQTTKKKKSKKKKTKSKNMDIKKKHKSNQQTEHTLITGISDARLSAYGINPKKFKNKIKYKK